MKHSQTTLHLKRSLRQEAESLSGERIPEKIAGRILMKHASLSETQRENLAVKHQALVDWNQVAAALRPLDRPEALIKTAAGTSNQTANQTYLDYGKAKSSMRTRPTTRSTVANGTRCMTRRSTKSTAARTTAMTT